MPDPVLLARELAKRLRTGSIEGFAEDQLSEDYLKAVADAAVEAGYLEVIVAGLLTKLTLRPSRAFDWNTGSLLQHADPEAVIKNIPTTSPQREALYESIGLTWCLGEFARRDPVVVRFLQDAVGRARSSASWFRAAQSLEKLGLVDAISYLKASLRAQGTPPLDSCLADLADYRNRIGLLLHATVDNLHERMLPRIKAVLLDPASDSFQQLGAAWLVGRFGFLDKEVEQGLENLLESSRYEVRFYSLQAVKDLGSPHFLRHLLEFLPHQDPLLRKMAAQGLARFRNPEVLLGLERQLDREQHPDVVGAITQALYDIKHHHHQRIAVLQERIGANENGMIVDEGDKWYVNPDIYHVFSESQDPEDIAFGIVRRRLNGRTIQNPVDLGSGTGRLAAFILRHIAFSGSIHCVDASTQMVQFLETRFKRESVPSQLLEVFQSTLETMPDPLGEGISDFVGANFAFPSRVADRELALRELKSVYQVLRPSGIFTTLGWDETFNDDLSEMWYRYIPDGVVAKDFEEWRRKRCDLLTSPRNCGLSWLKRGIRVPVGFTSDDTAARVMGYLFGRSAAQEILKTRKTSWSMSLGITWDTREAIGVVLENAGLL